MRRRRHRDRCDVAAGHHRIIAWMLGRDATDADWGAIWPFVQRIVAAGETYAYDTDMTEAEARRAWMVTPPGRV
jgi:hypothetical protein